MEKIGQISRNDVKKVLKISQKSKKKVKIWEKNQTKVIKKLPKVDQRKKQKNVR